MKLHDENYTSNEQNTKKTRRQLVEEQQQKEIERKKQISQKIKRNLKYVGVGLFTVALFVAGCELVLEKVTGPNLEIIGLSEKEPNVLSTEDPIEFSIFASSAVDTSTLRVFPEVIQQIGGDQYRLSLDTNNTFFAGKKSFEVVLEAYGEVKGGLSFLDFYQERLVEKRFPIDIKLPEPDKTNRNVTKYSQKEEDDIKDDNPPKKSIPKKSNTSGKKQPTTSKKEVPNPAPEKELAYCNYAIEKLNRSGAIKIPYNTRRNFNVIDVPAKNCRSINLNEITWKVRNQTGTGTSFQFKADRPGPATIFMTGPSITGDQIEVFVYYTKAITKQRLESLHAIVEAKGSPSERKSYIEQVRNLIHSDKVLVKFLDGTPSEPIDDYLEFVSTGLLQRTNINDVVADVKYNEGTGKISSITIDRR